MRSKVLQLSTLTRSSAFRPFPVEVHLHIKSLAAQLSQTTINHGSSTRYFTSSTRRCVQNRVYPSIRRPADFHTLLQSSSATNTLLLTLFKTTTCTSCGTITPLLESIVQDRAQPSPGDKFAAIAFAELELDSPERDEGGGSGWASMYDIGIEYGVRSVPTLIGYGGRRAERVTDRLADERKLKDRQWVESWIDEVMKNGDPHPSESRGLFGRIFGGGS